MVTATKGQLGFPNMATIIPKAKSGNWEIIHYDVSEQEVQLQAMRGAFSGRGWMDRGLKAGTYCVLKNNASTFDSTVMSDTYLERITNLDIVREANGKILVAGLGIGLILTAILDKPEVKEVVIIEKEQDVINLVAPYVKHPKLAIIHADIFEWLPEKGEKFDTIYFDIWSNICGDNYEEIKTLNHRFYRYLNRSNPKAFMDSWCRDEVKREHRRD